MLRSIKQLMGDKLAASDGEIGHVKDCYFDDRKWAIRYLVADTGAWLPGRQVLISPYSLGGVDPTGNVIRVNLTRKQIQKGPPIELRKPVLRQYEEAYHRYYGWPAYWLGDGLWGVTSFPILEIPASPLAAELAAATDPQQEAPGAHLQSTKAVDGYHIQASDGTIGHVCDFMMDTQTWAIRQLVVKTGHRLSGNEVQIPTRSVDRISYLDSKVFVNLTKSAIEQSPAHELAT